MYYAFFIYLPIDYGSFFYVPVKGPVRMMSAPPPPPVCPPALPHSPPHLHPLLPPPPAPQLSPSIITRSPPHPRLPPPAPPPASPHASRWKRKDIDMVTQQSLQSSLSNKHVEPVLSQNTRSSSSVQVQVVPVVQTDCDDLWSASSSCTTLCSATSIIQPLPCNPAAPSHIDTVLRYLSF